MKVVCIKNKYGADNIYTDRTISIGNEYEVIAVNFGESYDFLIEHDYNDFGWYEGSYFEISDGIIPYKWNLQHIKSKNIKHGYMLGPDYITNNSESYIEIFEGNQNIMRLVFEDVRERREEIKQFDVVKLLTEIPLETIPTGSLGTVTSPPDRREEMYEVIFYNEDGSSYRPIRVHRSYLHLDMKT